MTVRLFAGHLARLRQLKYVAEAALGGDLTLGTGSTEGEVLGDVERSVDALIEKLTAVVGTVPPATVRTS